MRQLLECQKKGINNCLLKSEFSQDPDKRYLEPKLKDTRPEMNLEEAEWVINIVLSELLPDTIEEKTIFIEIKDQRKYDPHAMGYRVWIKSHMIPVGEKLEKTKEIIFKRGFHIDENNINSQSFYVISESYPKQK